MDIKKLLGFKNIKILLGLLIIIVFTAFSLTACFETGGDETPDEPEVYVTSFETGVAPKIDSITSEEYARSIEEPDEPHIEGYAFKGWYSDAAFSYAKITFPYSVTGDAVLYAKFVRLFTLTFDTRGGSGIEPLALEEDVRFWEILNGDDASSYTPSKGGAVFSSWYLDDKLTQNNYYSHKMSADITLYAGYKVNGLTFAYRGTDENHDYEYYAIVDSDSGIAELNIPQTYNGLPVKRIDERAFSGRTALTDVYIPDYISEIGYGAFANCTGLKSIRFPKTLKQIESSYTDSGRAGNILGGRLGERNCDNIETVTFGTCDLGAGNYLFQLFGNSRTPASLTSVVIESGTVLPDESFSRAPGLTNIELPSTIKSIGNYAFMASGNLTNINLPDSLEYLGINAFQGCTLLAVDDPSADLGYIGNWLISVISRDAESLTLKSGTVGLYNAAFGTDATLLSSNIKVKALEIPATVKYLPGGAFYRCTSLSSLTLHEGLLTIGGDLFNGTAVSASKMNIPESVVSVGQNSFSNIRATTENAVLENGVYYLSNWAVGLANYSAPPASISIRAGIVGICNGFIRYNENVLSVSLPNSIKYVGESAFKNCTKLTSLQCLDLSNVVSIGEEAFRGTDIRMLVLGDKIQSLALNVFADVENLILYYTQEIIPAAIKLPAAVTVYNSAQWKWHNGEPVILS